MQMLGQEILLKATIHQPTWYFIYLFLLTGFFAWIRVYYGNIIIQTVQASVNFQMANRMFNDNSLLQNQLDKVLYLFYFLSMGFLLYYVELRLGRIPYDLHGLLLFLFNLALLAGVFLGRLLMLNMAGVFFNRIKVLREYLYNVFIFNKLTGIAILPLIFLLVYTRGILQDVIFWLTLLVVFGIFLMRLIRGVEFSYRKEVLIFYMFLYLCALEIVPLVLLYRWLEGVL
ncbi:MAG: DUF4271 domain-containing protein [Bacteroidia bacterium]|nr:MAG: DUF4271 domain-containing protein [Bacteroidia bacterium]